MILRNAGQYRHPISIESQAPVKNGFGERVNTWVEFVKTRASISPVSGKELISSMAVESDVTHKVGIRFMPGITPAMRINFNGRIFMILSVINFQELGRELQLMCKEVV